MECMQCRGSVGCGGCPVPPIRQQTSVGERLQLVWLVASACAAPTAEDVLLKLGRLATHNVMCQCAFCARRPPVHGAGAACGGALALVDDGALAAAYQRPLLARRRAERGSYMDLLCDDELMVIFTHLDEESYVAAMHVCTRWSRVAGRSDTRKAFRSFWATQPRPGKTVELERGSGQTLGLRLKKAAGQTVVSKIEAEGQASLYPGIRVGLAVTHVNGEDAAGLSMHAITTLIRSRPSCSLTFEDAYRPCPTRPRRGFGSRRDKLRDNRGDPIFQVP